MTDLTPETLRFRDYVRPIVERIWLVAFLVGAITAFAYFYSSAQPDRFRASTTLLLSIDTTTIDSVSVLSDRSIGNQVELIRSREVSAAVAKRLGRPGEAGSLASSVTATTQTGRDFVVVTADRPNAQDAARLANAYAQAFIDLRRQAQRDRTQKLLDESRVQLEGLPAGSSAAARRAQLQSNIQQYELTLKASTGAAQQINPAVAPDAPYTPRPRRDALLAFFVSLIGAAALAYAMQAFDRRLKRIEDVSKHYGLPVLALTPRTDEAVVMRDGRVVIGDALTEPLRHLRSNVQLALETLPPRLLVTSAMASEGKSTVASGLAISLREAGLKVALVDADLRKPRLASLLAPQTSLGLTDVLIGTHAIEDVVQLVPVQAIGLRAVAKVGASTTVHAPIVDNAEPSPDVREEITLLPAGKPVADPSTILASPRTQAVIDALVETHDIVIIDSAPLLNVADSAALAGAADAVLVVARLGQATQDTAARLRETLHRIPDVNAIGVVVNDVPVGEGHGYGYGYGYGYGQTATS